MIERVAVWGSEPVVVVDRADVGRIVVDGMIVAVAFHWDFVQTSH